MSMRAPGTRKPFVVTPEMLADIADWAQDHPPPEPYVRTIQIAPQPRLVRPYREESSR